MRLVEHKEAGIETGRLALGRVDEFVEHTEQAERVEPIRIEVVVAVFRIVRSGNWSELAGSHQPAILLDVGVGRVVAEIDEAVRLRAQRLGCHQAGPPQSEITVACNAGSHSLCSTSTCHKLRIDFGQRLQIPIEDVLDWTGP